MIIWVIHVNAFHRIARFVIYNYVKGGGSRFWLVVFNYFSLYRLKTMSINKSINKSCWIRPWPVEGKSNHNKTCYKVKINRSLHCCSPLMQFLLAHSNLPSASSVRYSFARCCRQFPLVIINLWLTSIH